MVMIIVVVVVVVVVVVLSPQPLLTVTVPDLNNGAVALLHSRRVSTAPPAIRAPPFG